MWRNAAALLLLAGVAPPAFADEPDGRVPVAVTRERVWHEEDVRGPAALRIYQHQLDIYSLVRGETEERIDAHLLAQEAARRGTSVEAMLASVMEGGEPVPDAEVDAYLAEHPDDTGAPPEERRARVRHYLEETRRLERRIAFLEGLREAAGYRFLLAPPTPPRTEVDVAGAPVRGPADAPVEIVHFASFSSRNSARSAAKLARLEAEFPGRIRWIHRNLLRDRDERGLHAARLGYAALEDGRFWPLHDAWFSRAGTLDGDDVEEIALQNGVSADRIGAARSDGALLRRVKADLDAANAAGAPREPTLFVNGRFLSGIAPYEEIRAVVVEELGDVPAGNDPGRPPTVPFSP
jgi:protein-disulfide isomerase